MNSVSLRVDICLNTQVASKKKPNPEVVEIRRAPKILPWALTGAIFGAIAAFILYLFIPADQRSSENILGLLFLSLASLGFGVGLAFAITVDLLSSRSAKRAEAERVVE